MRNTGEKQPVFGAFIWLNNNHLHNICPFAQVDLREAMAPNIAISFHFSVVSAHFQIKRLSISSEKLMNTGDIVRFFGKSANDRNQLARYVHREGQAGYFLL
ncbi:hypothetical protein [Rhizobium tubonense]|uniref:hypothetical protein n=1 Tax=Rhizobium tubonense TaxID=484088 RepID=UPI0011B52D6F|nr:hypothetical protein [Rhizobium tubonense]